MLLSKERHHAAYGKRQTANINLLLSPLNLLYTKVIIIYLHLLWVCYYTSIFFVFLFVFLLDWFKHCVKSKQSQRKFLLSVVNVLCQLYHNYVTFFSSQTQHNPKCLQTHGVKRRPITPPRCTKAKLWSELFCSHWTVGNLCLSLRLHFALWSRENFEYFVYDKRQTAIVASDLAFLFIWTW